LPNREEEDRRRLIKTNLKKIARLIFISKIFFSRFKFIIINKYDYYYTFYKKYINMSFTRKI